MVDNAVGKWGHVHADQFEFSKTPKSVKPYKPVPPSSLIESFAEAEKINAETLRSWCLHFTKPSNLQSFTERISSAKKTHTELINAENTFIEGSKLFANFNSVKLPEGWKISGEAFKPRGNTLIPLDHTALFPIQMFFPLIFWVKRELEIYDLRTSKLIIIKF